MSKGDVKQVVHLLITINSHCNRVINYKLIAQQIIQMLRRQFLQFQQKAVSQLNRLYGPMPTKPNIRKSASLQPYYKVIPLPTIHSAQFRQFLEHVTSQHHSDMATQGSNVLSTLVSKSLNQLLIKTQQYVTACINVLEHNERVRQRYERVLEGSREDEGKMKEVKELARRAGKITCKGEFGRFIEENAKRVMGGSDGKGEMGEMKGSPSKGSMNGNLKSNVSIVGSKQPLVSISQIAPLYIPLHADHYQFITQISSSQYLSLHESTLQHLLITLTSINTLTRQLPHQSSSFISSLTDLLSQLSTQEMFNKQDSGFSRVVRYVLGFVFGARGSVEKRNQSQEYWWRQMRQSVLRIYYLQYISKQQLQTLTSQLLTSIKPHHLLLTTSPSPPNLQQLQQSLSTYTATATKLKHISDYLCDRQQMIFKQFYDRKIRKVILKLQQARNLVTFGRKLVRKLVEKNEEESLNQYQGQEKQRQSDNMFKKGQQFRYLKDEVERFQHSFSKIQVEIHALIQQIQQFNRAFQQTQSQVQSLLTKFYRLFRRQQQLQIQFSSLSKQSLKLSNDKSSEINFPQIKSRILKIQQQLIKAARPLIKKQSKEGNRGLIEKQSIYEKDELRDSRISEFSMKSSKSSVFQLYRIRQDQIVSSKPLPSNVINSGLKESLNVDQVIMQGNNFIQNMTKNSNKITVQLQDLRNVNIPKLNHIVLLIESQMNSLTQFGKKDDLTPVKITQSPTKQSPTKNQSPKKQQQRKPTKSKSKPQQSSSSKSPSKTKQKQQTSNPQPNIKLTTLNLLKNKLIFIREVLLLPEISQSKIHRMFQNQLQLSIFDKFVDIITDYKNRIYSKQTYDQSVSYGLSQFLQQRTEFVLTIAKNLQAMRKIFVFVQIFSEQKIKLQPAQETSYELLIKAILAVKEVESYRQQNQDLVRLNNGKVSKEGVRFLENQIYSPFIDMFRGIIKATSQNIVKELQQMVQVASISQKQIQKIRNIMSARPNQQSIDQTKKDIKAIIDRLTQTKRFAIFNYKKIDLILKTLQSSLYSQDNTDSLVDYLKAQLTKPLKGSFEPLIQII